MIPQKFYLVCLLIFCAIFTNGASFDFHPKISVLGFNSSPTNIKNRNYGEGQINLPVNIFINDKFSLQAEYFLAYDYFNKETDFYDKLNRAAISFDTNKFTFKAGRDFLDLNLNSVVYFGPYQNRDLKKPTYFDGALANFKPSDIVAVSLLGGTFKDKDFYGATLAISYFKGFYFLSKENDLDLSTYGAAFDINTENFDLDLLAAFNSGTKSKEILGITVEDKYKGKNFSGDIKLKRDKEDFKSAISFGVEYLSPDKNNSLGYRPILANLDRGFVFGNLTEDLETLTYKLGFSITPKSIKELSADMKIYNFSSTDKRKTSRDIASEIDLSIQYKISTFSAQIIYGYLQANQDFSSYTSGFEDKPTIHKLGFILSYQF